MLLVLLRFFQQSWHTMIQPRVLWVAPRVLVSGPPFPHSAHVPMFGLWCGMVDKVSPLRHVIRMCKIIYEIRSTVISGYRDV